MEEEGKGFGKIVYDGKRMRKAITRRNVDYSGPILKDKLQAGFGVVQKHPLYSIYTPPVTGASSLSNSLTVNLAHTSINKIRTPINTIKYTPNGRRLISGGATGEFTLWNGFSFNFETILQAHDTSLRTMCWTPHGDYLVSGDQAGVIKYWQPSMNNVHILSPHKEAIRDISFSPRGTKFCTASDDGTIKIIDFQAAKEEYTLSGHGWDVRVAQWHKRHALIASGGKDNLIKLWDPRGKEKTTLHIHKNTILCLKWTNDGESILSGGKDQVIKMFNLRAMKEEFSHKGHQREVTALSPHPCLDSLFVSGGGEGGVYIWQRHNEYPIRVIPDAHNKTIWSMDFHPVGHTLATSSVDNTVRFWIRSRPTTESISGEHTGIEFDHEKIPGIGSIIQE
ncbi:polyadenylation factor subunit 2 [Nematocida sp. LUAm3]|nr:polyadenylation factor subunit 2 [Nematocida sp. LUAm3]KAI5174027.1 polyadenylation factor subunit 2 [Nematocida sp. LUAm2]KAI5177230.1 polyadenylation factor subunit 2 [Nematocida sp. LUAm1]